MAQRLSGAPQPITEAGNKASGHHFLRAGLPKVLQLGTLARTLFRARKNIDTIINGCIRDL